MTLPIVEYEPRHDGSGARRHRGREAAMTSPFVGSWSYRSFQNNPDLAVPFDALRFGAGTLALTEPTFGQVAGTLGGPGWSLALAGHYTYGNPNHARFQGCRPTRPAHLPGVPAARAVGRQPTGLSPHRLHMACAASAPVAA